MDEFEVSLEKIAKAQAQTQKGVTKYAGSGDVPTARIEMPSNMFHVEDCLDFYNKSLLPILDAVNKRVLFGFGSLAVFAKGVSDYQSGVGYARDNTLFCAALVWTAGSPSEGVGAQATAHSLGFDLGDNGGDEFTTEVFAGRIGSRIVHDRETIKRFAVQRNDLSEVKKYVLELLSNPLTTTVGIKPESGGYYPKDDSGP